MVWAGMSTNSRPLLVIFDGNLTARRYIEEVLSYLRVTLVTFVSWPDDLNTLVIKIVIKFQNKKYKYSVFIDAEYVMAEEVKMKYFNDM